MSNTQLHLLSTSSHALIITQYSINNINKICTKRASKAIHLYAKNSWSKWRSFNFRTAAHVLRAAQLLLLRSHTTTGSLDSFLGHQSWWETMPHKVDHLRCTTERHVSLCLNAVHRAGEKERPKKERTIKTVKYWVQFLLSLRRKITVVAWANTKMWWHQIISDFLNPICMIP